MSTAWRNIVQIASAAGGFAGAIAALLAVLTLRHMGKTNNYQVFHAIVSRYGSAEMLVAIDRLHKLKEFCASTRNIKEVYEETKRAEFDRMMEQPFQKRLTFVKTTLHYQRRIVSHFYYYLATAITNKMIQRRIAYRFWEPRTIKMMIEEILEPIHVDEISYLRMLVEDANRYERRRRLLRFGIPAAISVSVLITELILIVVLDV
jgi:hypothetical protein